jgi:hypothetical protein
MTAYCIGAFLKQILTIRIGSGLIFLTTGTSMRVTGDYFMATGMVIHGTEKFFL